MSTTRTRSNGFKTPDASGLVTCNKCGKPKPLSEFYKREGGVQYWCKACQNGHPREKRIYPREQTRRWELKKRYNCTPGEIDALLITQNGKCAICEKTLAKYHIDHDHETKKIRGLLCHRCNVRLGGLDDTEWRVKALAYLKV